MLSQEYQNKITTILDKIQEADAIVVGGAAGISAAAGYNWYNNDETFKKYFGNFAYKYGIENIFRSENKVCYHKNIKIK